MVTVCLPWAVTVLSGWEDPLCAEDFGARFGHGFVPPQQVHRGPRRSWVALLPISKSPDADAEHGCKGALRAPCLFPEGPDVLAGREAMKAGGLLLTPLITDHFLGPFLEFRIQIDVLRSTHRHTATAAR